MDTINLLTSARAIISSPENWCRGHRNNGGAHCALGALDEALGEYADDHMAVVVLAEALTPEERAKLPADLPNHHYYEAASDVARFNNASDHAAVLALFDRAIERHRTVMGLASEQVPECVPA